MKIIFWGVRGSIPRPSHEADTKWKLDQILTSARGLSLDTPRAREEFIQSLPPHLLHPVGGNTSCVEIVSGEDRVILDGGSGLRKLGLELIRASSFNENDLYLAIETGADLGAYEPPAPEGGGLDLTLLFSHTHWDHIQGFPFFTPAYVPGGRLRLYGRDGTQLARALEAQQDAPLMFPIPLSGMGAEISFHSLPPEGLKVGNITISFLELPHPGGSLAFRLEADGRRAVYATDYEFRSTDDESAAIFTDFITEADLLISDTQYTYLESVAREGWGHSTSFSAVDLAIRAGVRSVYFFHHDPEHSDYKLFDNLEKTRAYHALMSGQGRMDIELAVEGLTLEI